MMIRPPAVAGSFYPADARSLNQLIDQLRDSDKSSPGAPALIVPHAGYIYSGRAALRACQRIPPQTRRVVILGPSHRVAFRGIALTSADAYATPLGEVAIDHEAAGEIADMDWVGTLDQAHRDEHSIEVQLPLLQRSLTGFRFLPLVVGETRSEWVEAVIERLWSPEDTLIMVSTDLSHFLSYEEASRVDASTSAAIERLDEGAIGDHDACGRHPLRGLLRFARKQQMVVERLALYNSGDESGVRDRVVGYGAYAIHAKSSASQQLQ